MYILITEDGYPYIVQKITEEIEKASNEGYIILLKIEGDREVSQYLGEDTWEELSYYGED